MNWHFSRENIFWVLIFEMKNPQILLPNKLFRRRCYFNAIKKINDFPIFIFLYFKIVH